jgi:hypothetical protein
MVRLSRKHSHQATEIHVPSGAHADVNASLAASFELPTLPVIRL